MSEENDKKQLKSKFTKNKYTDFQLLAIYS